MADNMKKENTNQLIPLLVGVSIFSLLLVLSILAVWTGPSGTPPNLNAPAPINVSNSGQEKEGQLGISIPSGESLAPSYGLTVGTASKPLGIKTSGSSLFEQNLTAMGNVGIGTASPGQKLQVAGNIVMQSGGYLDDDSTMGEVNDDWIQLAGYIEMRSNTDSYGIVLRNKDASDYLGITQVNGYSYLTDSSSYSNYFLRGGGANIHVRGGITMGTQTRYYSITPSDFTVYYPSTDLHTIHYTYARADQNGRSFVAPVHLPHNAIVKEVKLYGSPGGTETWYFRRIAMGSQGTYVTVAQANFNEADIVVGGYPTINNQGYSYGFVTSTLDNGDKIYGGYIKYTITSPYP